MKRILLITTCLMVLILATYQKGYTWGFFTGSSPGTIGGTTINISTCTGCKLVNVQDIPEAAAVNGKITPDDGISDNAALKTYLDTHKTNTIYYFPKGTYTWTHPIDDDTRGSLEYQGLTNIAFVGEPGAVLQKVGGTGYNHEWMFNLAHGTNVTFTGLEFAGLYTSTAWNSGNYQSTGGSGGFGEQGIHCASCDGFYVDRNYFHDFGDGAVRAASSGDDAPCTSLSTNTWITNNRFDNIFQITTTNNVANSGGSCNWGGSNHWNFIGNRVTRLKGSVKYCARYTTDSGLIAFNHISGTNITNNGTSPASPSDQVDIELCGVSDTLITGNVLELAGQRAIHAYTNPQPHNFPWGWLTITNNIIHDCSRSIRIANNAYPDGVTVPFNNLLIEGNSIYKNTLTDEPGISLAGSGYRGGLITNNIITGTPAGSTGQGVNGATGVTTTGNIYTSTP